MTRSDWWHPARHADRHHLLRARNRIQRALRDWFAGEDFTEVDPSALVVSPGNETHLHAFATTLEDDAGVIGTRYLHTSPEFAMKKLIAAGERRIFAFAHVWRNREAGPRHAAEFTMLEWYRCEADYTRLMADVARMAQIAAREAGAEALRRGDDACDPFAPFERLSVADAFTRHAGIDLAATLGADGTPDAGALRVQMEATGLRPGADDTWSDMFSHVLVARIEARLGYGHLTMLDRYPAAEAALARRCPDDPRFAERFEAYACGVELANGFGELTDPVEQRARFTAEMDMKERLYGTRYPLDEDLLEALALMPPTAGIALGFDRLVMLATNAPRIDLVQWAPAG